jgi:hypothetical protein
VAAVAAERCARRSAMNASMARMYRSKERLRMGSLLFMRGP